MQIKDVQFRQILQILDLFDVVLTKHEHTQSWNGVQMTDVLNVIVVEIEEDQVRKTDKVLNLGDQVVLQVQQTEALLALKEGHVGKFPLVQLQSFWV